MVQRACLVQEMVRRGWAASDLARESRLSEATISAALTGRPIAARSLGLIAVALSRVPPIAGIDALLGPDTGRGELA
jgi:lambda repressor-like predicted transcriptional regulator